MIHRLPITENLRQHVKSIISMMLKLLKTDNEENVLISLRIIIELHKHFRPCYNPEVSIHQFSIAQYNQQILFYISKRFSCF